MLDFRPDEREDRLSAVLDRQRVVARTRWPRGASLLAVLLPALVATGALAVVVVQLSNGSHRLGGPVAAAVAWAIVTGVAAVASRRRHRFYESARVPSGSVGPRVATAGSAARSGPGQRPER